MDESGFFLNDYTHNIKSPVEYIKFRYSDTTYFDKIIKYQLLVYSSETYFVACILITILQLPLFATRLIYYFTEASPSLLRQYIATIILILHIISLFLMWSLWLLDNLKNNLQYIDLSKKWLPHLKVFFLFGSNLYFASRFLSVIYLNDCIIHNKSQTNQNTLLSVFMCNPYSQSEGLPVQYIMGLLLAPLFIQCFFKDISFQLYLLNWIFILSIIIFTIVLFPVIHMLALFTVVMFILFIFYENDRKFVNMV